MHWYYRLQQRIAITKTECNVLLALAALFGLGLLVRHFREGARPVPPDAYAQELAAFEAASSGTLTSDNPTARTDSVARPVPGRSQAEASDAGPLEPIDVNSASGEALQRLPHVGPAIAARIVAYREIHGPFRRVDELARVKGIGAKTVARLAPLVRVEDAAAAPDPGRNGSGPPFQARRNDPG